MQQCPSPETWLQSRTGERDVHSPPGSKGAAALRGSGILGSVASSGFWDCCVRAKSASTSRFLIYLNHMHSASWASATHHVVQHCGRQSWGRLGRPAMGSGAVAPACDFSTVSSFTLCFSLSPPQPEEYHLLSTYQTFLKWSSGFTNHHTYVLYIFTMCNLHSWGHFFLRFSCSHSGAENDCFL